MPCSAPSAVTYIKTDDMSTNISICCEMCIAPSVVTYRTTRHIMTWDCDMSIDTPRHVRHHVSLCHMYNDR